MRTSAIFGIVLGSVVASVVGFFALTALAVVVAAVVISPYEEPEYELQVKAASAPPLDATASDKLAAHAQWMKDLYSVDFPDAYGADAGSDSVAKLIEVGSSYPGSSEQVPAQFAEAERLVGEGYALLNSGKDGPQQSAAMFTAAEQALQKIADAAITEVEALESSTGYRLGNDGVQDDGVDATSATIERWIDGDTVETDQGRVRLIGVDTPEVTQECAAAQEATDAANAMAPPGTSVELVNPASVDDADKYDRLLRYVVLEDASDVGYTLLLNGLGEARYDAADGYDWHPRQKAYREAGAIVDDTEGSCAWGAAAAAGLLLPSDDDDDDHVARALLLARVADWPGRSLGTFAAARSSAQRHYEAVAEREAEEERQAREAEAARQADADRQARQDEPAPTRTSESSSGSSSGGFDPDTYTGCRQYAPGGKTWKPIPCP